MNDYNDELYGEIYKVDATKEWLNGAYDEYGNQINCNLCGEPFAWNPKRRKWCCTNCETTKTRVQWFDYIDADPPGPKCLTLCRENYPVCKNWCTLYDIPDDDPIL